MAAVLRLLPRHSDAKKNVAQRLDSAGVHLSCELTQEVVLLLEKLLSQVGVALVVEERIQDLFFVACEGRVDDADAALQAAMLAAIASQNAETLHQLLVGLRVQKNFENFCDFLGADGIALVVAEP